VKEHGLPLDAEYYLEHSLNSPLESLFELFMVNPSKELFERVKREYYGSQQINMKKWFEEQIRKKLKLNTA
jgi:DNA polymerase elongation subunit (family B)